MSTDAGVRLTVVVTFVVLVVGIYAWSAHHPAPDPSASTPAQNRADERFSVKDGCGESAAIKADGDGGTYRHALRVAFSNAPDLPRATVESLCHRAWKRYR